MDALLDRKDALLQWTVESKKTTSDMKDRPAKLRPEAAQHDVNQLVDLKQLISEKQNQIDEIESQLTSLVPSSAQVIDELRSKMSTLYDETSDVLDKKLDRQNCVEEYRLQLQDFYLWLDSLLKRSENADRGHGQNISQRVLLLEELAAESHQGKSKLAEISSKVNS